MNIFSALKVYAGRWNESNVRPFDINEIAAVDYVKIEESTYGLSACFFMKTGGMTYIPVDQNTHAIEGQVVDLTKALLVTLSRPGDKDIFRIRF